MKHPPGFEQAERTALTGQILNIDKRLVTLLRAGVQSDFLQSDLTMPQLKVLLLLTSGESSHLHMSQLSEALRVTMPTATGIVDRLVEQGLLQRLHDPRDRRLVVVGLTDRGQGLMQRLLAADRMRLEAVLKRLNLDDLRTVARALDLMLEAVLDYTRDCPCPTEQTLEER